jgi:NADH-quinone oxidoreductase subunit G
MAIITINGRDIEFGEQESLNLIQAAQRAGIEIPHYCWHPALSVVASCRMCLVEVGEKRADGSVAMQPRLVPACQTPARHGTVVITNSPKVRAAQAATLEFLLLNHPLDCPVCDQAGECWLQDYSYKYGRSRSRLRDEKTHSPRQRLYWRANCSFYRPLYHVYPVCSLYSRNKRHRRIASYPPG